MDYYWFDRDNALQQDYSNCFQGIPGEKGVSSFGDQFNPDGSLPAFILPAGGFQKLRHSQGLVASSACTEIIYNRNPAFDFVHATSNARLQPYADGYFDPYYDGLVFLFNLLHFSGNYRVIQPQ
jgi:oligosaccharide reducing-end xylanase